MIEYESEKTSSRDFVLVRLFAAPQPVVFKAWTDGKLVQQWWGPDRFTIPFCEVDARPGGTVRIDMRGPDGIIYPMKGVFHEIIEPVRIVLTHSALEDEGGTPALMMLITVTFDVRGDGTEMGLKVSILKAAPEAAMAVSGMEEGWNQSLDRLAEFLTTT